MGEWEGHSNIGKLNSGLYKEKYYSKAVFKAVDSWGAIRNDADHREWDDLKPEAVGLMIQGIRNFIAQHEG